jgi:hypothetical protein
VSDRAQLQADRRRLEQAYRDAYTALDEHFVLYGDVDGPEPIGLLNYDGPYALPDESDDQDDQCDFTEGDVVT